MESYSDHDEVVIDILAVDASVIASPLLDRALERLKGVAQVLQDEAPAVRNVLCFDGQADPLPEQLYADAAGGVECVDVQGCTPVENLCEHARILTRGRGLEINRVWWVSSKPLTQVERRWLKPLCFDVHEVKIPLGGAPDWKSLVREINATHA